MSRFLWFNVYFCTDEAYTTVTGTRTDRDKVALQTKVADMRRLSELPDELRMRRRHVNQHQVEKFMFI